jgi:hypothetical protein
LERQTTQAEQPYPADPSHALGYGVPQIGNAEAEMIGDLFLDCILDMFEVSPD